MKASDNSTAISRYPYSNACLIKVLSAIFTLCFSSLSFAALDRIGDFALLDDSGKFHQLSRYQHREALVMMAYDRDCAAMPQMLSSYRELQEQYSPQGFEFLLLDPQDLERETWTGANVGLPILKDDGQLVAETLGLSRAGEVLVLNPDRLSLFYKGPTGTELADTLVGITSQTIRDTVSLPVEGCEIEFPMSEQHSSTPPDYSAEIGPMIVDNCTECHRWGGVGPFALDSYIMVLGWSPMIREVLLNKRMPPAQVDPHIGYSRNARYLAGEDLQKLIHWIDAGAPRGDGEVDPLEAQVFEESEGWQLGEPDYIVTGPVNEIPPTGVLDYIYVDIDLPFEEDKWIRAVEHRAGEEAVLHHLMTFVTGPDEDFWGPEREQESVTRRFVEGYAPGKQMAVEFAEGAAVRIPKGHKLSMQFHYVTNGQGVEDETQLALYFADPEQVANGKIAEQFTQAVSSRFLLKPNDPEHPMHAMHTIDEDIMLTGVRARMNFRGKHMKFSVEYPDGKMVDVFSVPAYNYGWQPNYHLEQPLSVPAGSTLHVIGAFDNSISNPANPDPDKEVEFGLESWDEMFTGYFTYHAITD